MSKKDFLELCEDFMKRTKISATRLGWLATGNPQLIFGLRKGREAREETQNKVFAFIEKYESEER